MPYVIATRPGRTVRRAKNNVQKYAQLRADSKFKFVTELEQATLFPSMSDAFKALGSRAQKLRRPPTGDLTVFEVQRSAFSVVKRFNGS